MGVPWLLVVLLTFQTMIHLPHCTLKNNSKIFWGPHYEGMEKLLWTDSIKTDLFMVEDLWHFLQRQSSHSDGVHLLPPIIRNESSYGSTAWAWAAIGKGVPELVLHLIYMINSWDSTIPSRNVFVPKSRISTELRLIRLHEELAGFVDPPTMTISLEPFNREHVWWKRQVLMSGPFVQVLSVRSRNQVSQNPVRPAIRFELVNWEYILQSIYIRHR